MVKVIINRTIAEGLEQHYDHCLRDTAPLMQEAQGFLGSEILRDVENPCHRVTVSLWDNAQSWSQWLHSDERRKLHTQIDPLLDREEKIMVLTR